VRIPPGYVYAVWLFAADDEVNAFWLHKFAGRWMQTSQGLNPEAGDQKPYTTILRSSFDRAEAASRTNELVQTLLHKASEKFERVRCLRIDLQSIIPDLTEEKFKNRLGYEFLASCGVFCG
jgi:hypothetical protein